MAKKFTIWMELQENLCNEIIFCLPRAAEFAIRVVWWRVCFFCGWFMPIGVNNLARIIDRELIFEKNLFRNIS